MNKKDEVVAEISDETRLWVLALLCDTSLHLNDLHTKVQSQQKLSEMKLKQLENATLCHFPSCDLLYKDGSVSVPFPSILAVEIIDYLVKNFK
jgi:hypothetical protein